MGNEYNTPGVDLSNSRWTGDLVTAVWDVTDTNPADRSWSPRSHFVLKGAMREGGNRIELRLSDSTGAVEEAELELKGIGNGRYLVRYGGVENRITVSDVLRFSLPIPNAEQIRIERVSAAVT